ncbi:hypothetical protein GF420_12855 [candidate division GN15 bacterium]|nr:hypothetical protein [candidate division GN15 bacterium]
MKSRNIMTRIFLAGLLLMPLSGATQTLQESLNGVFVEVLDINLAGPGAHGSHYRPSNVSTSQAVISSLGSLISTSASQFPLSSTSVGLTFDLSSGVPVATRTSAGPIFGERAQTLGKGRLNAGMNYSSLDLAKIRGLNVDEVEFVFLHQNIGSPDVYGDNANEHDYIRLNMNLDLDATVIAFYGTYGLSDRFDVGIAIPYVSVSMQAEPFARMNSYTYISSGSANHYFDGSSTDPVLTLEPTAVDNTARGLGDITLRAKWHAYQGETHDVGLLGQATLATGDEENFLGQGSSSYLFGAIASTSWGDFSPYVNLGYDIRSSELVRNRIALAIGYDQRLSDRFTLALEWNGQFETGDQLPELTFPSDVEIAGPVGSTSRTSQSVELTNIPAFESDNLTNASFGVKYTPSPKFLAYANIILPTNDGGLRSNAITTFGLEFNL